MYVNNKTYLKILLLKQHQQKGNRSIKLEGYLALFLWNWGPSLVWYQWLQFLASSQGVYQRLLMKFYALCVSSLKAVVHKSTYSQKVILLVRHSCVVRAISLWSNGTSEGLVEWYDQIFEFSIWFQLNTSHLKILRIFMFQFMLTENRSTDIQKKKIVYFFSNLATYSQIPLSESMAAYFSLFTGLC